MRNRLGAAATFGVVTLIFAVMAVLLFFDVGPVYSEDVSAKLVSWCIVIIGLTTGAIAAAMLLEFLWLRSTKAALAGRTGLENFPEECLNPTSRTIDIRRYAIYLGFFRIVESPRKVFHYVGIEALGECECVCNGASCSILRPNSITRDASGADTISDSFRGEPRPLRKVMMTKDVVVMVREADVCKYIVALTQLSKSLVA